MHLRIVGRQMDMAVTVTDVVVGAPLCEPRRAGRGCTYTETGLATLEAELLLALYVVRCVRLL